MTSTTRFDLDETGKIDLSAIYDRPDPRNYYQTLVNLGYQIPALAEPSFRDIIRKLREVRERSQIKLLDVGSSYGVNALLLNHDISLDQLFRLYSREATKGFSRSDLVARDRKFFAEARNDRDLAVIGLDVAGEALDYAQEVGVIEAGVSTNLERRPPSIREKQFLSGTDIVISTGAIGYVGVPTFSRILECVETAPWFALLALRMFPFNEIAALLRSQGYVVYRERNRTYRQRKFASVDEKRQVLARLASLNIDPSGLEADGWYYAELYFAWREGEVGPPPVKGLTPL